MADGERIPIILDEPAAEVGAAVTDERGIVTMIEEDGTLRMVLPTPQHCEPANADEIAVCATVVDANPAPPPAIAEDNTDPLALNLGENATIGPTVSTGRAPLGGSDVRASITLKITF